MHCINHRRVPAKFEHYHRLMHHARFSERATSGRAPKGHLVQGASEGLPVHCLRGCRKKVGHTSLATELLVYQVTNKGHINTKPRDISCSLAEYMGWDSSRYRNGDQLIIWFLEHLWFATLFYWCPLYGTTSLQ